MDPARYWMLTKRKLGEQKAPLFPTPSITIGSGGSISSASYYESWEDRAFAEDSAGHLGGCIWPPRSYSCSFCGREFRSAQALGGHMNVHRRDRARLKLAGVVDDGVSDSQIVPHSQSYMIQQSCPPQIASLQHAYVANPNAPDTKTNPDPFCGVVAHPPISSGQASTARNIWGNQILSAPLASLPGLIHSGKNDVFEGAAQSSPNHPRLATRICSNQELHVRSGERNRGILVCRTRKDRDSSDDEDSVHVGYKRRRIDLETSPLSLRCFPGKDHQDGEDNGQRTPDDHKVRKHCPIAPVEELDLELRLGDARKVQQ